MLEFRVVEYFRFIEGVNGTLPSGTIAIDNISYYDMVAFINEL